MCVHLWWLPLLALSEEEEGDDSVVVVEEVEEEEDVEGEEGDDDEVMVEDDEDEGEEVVEEGDEEGEYTVIRAIVTLLNTCWNKVGNVCFPVHCLSSHYFSAVFLAVT